MDTLKKILSFLIVIVYAFCMIGSTSYLFYYHLPQFAVANLLLGIMAFPVFRNAWKELTN